MVVSYMPEPHQRGTFGLLWSCLSTLILCVWTAMHPNLVPVQRPLAKTYYKLCLMICAIIFPEMIMCMAVAQWLHAKRVHRAWLDAWKGDDERQQWLGLSGSFFVIMGGFVVNETQGAGSSCQWSKDGQRISQQSGHDKLVTTIGENGFIELLNNGFIQDLVNKGHLTRAHFDHRIIDDKGKSSNIAKTIAVVQVLWMMVQIIGRKAAGLPITLLEVHVAIQIPYSVIAYICWWSKPLDVAQPIQIPLDREQLLGHDCRQETKYPFYGQLFITERPSHGSFPHMLLRSMYDVSVFFDHGVELASAVTAVLTGGLHATAWHWHFPSSAERLLWRMAAIGTGAFPTIAYLIVRNRGIELFLIRLAYYGRFNNRSTIKQVFDIFVSMCDAFRGAADLGDCESLSIGIKSKPSSDWPPWMPPWFRVVLMSVFLVCGLTYMLCILYLTVESFVSLRSVPVGVYSTLRWSSIFPHL
ncbi:hypothetical protein BO94DRAFT_532186 [Aspergillus sclerotioniger CBS 115572]|uniref:Uncharacterized protein n=1 Tax=Aspergillus sclerotioniger CBS 115572 TaxID=1450535 RepID=A0A317X7B7_9EURO|nr:hypothetical protein BO94DRAFT_532186 [Aspergillus sclerotioniger CBS 115572]PWY94235.1 hypothetical protein BO94DRAFT_532186 [Aspergillus sclerotioniger CBS 115572]